MGFSGHGMATRLCLSPYKSRPFKRVPRKKIVKIVIVGDDVQKRLDPRATTTLPKNDVPRLADDNSAHRTRIDPLDKRRKYSQQAFSISGQANDDF